MKIYKLKNSELAKIHNEFNRTAFGGRAKLFSIIPSFLIIFFVVALYFDTNAVADALYILAIVISLIGLCITQLIYGNMLKDYLNEKEQK